MAASTKADSRGLVTTIMAVGADEQHEIAQRDRYRGADRGLDLGGVGGEPRDQLAGLGVIEKGADSEVRWPNTSLRRSATMRSPSVVTR